MNSIFLNINFSFVINWSFYSQFITKKYNYYQMFFDEVLTKKKIAYAVSSLKGKQLHYNFYSMVNFTQEYASWLELRSKNSPNQPNDVIGIDV